MDHPEAQVNVDFYRGVLEHAPWGAIVAATEIDGRCLYVNPEFTRITGYALEHIPTTTDWIQKAYPDPAYRQKILENWALDTSPEQMDRDVIYRVQCRDGTSKQVQFRAGMLDAGQMIVMLLDVTERRQMERQLQDREERYRLLVETSPFGIVLHAGTTIDYANATAQRLMGADSPEQLVGRPVIDFVHQDELQSSLERMAEVRQSGRLVGPAETRFVRLDGEIIEVEINGGLVPFQGQTAIQITFSDISERKRMERERRALDQRMQQAQRTESLSLLAGGVAHDLNNLLVGVLGHTDLAQRLVAGDSPLDGHLRAVMESAEGAAELVGQLLAYAGQRKLSEQSVDLNLLVTRTEGLLRSVVDRRATLHIDLAPDLPWIEGDEVQLRQVLLNLVSNAADAMAGLEGQISIRTGQLSADDPALGLAFAPKAPAPVKHLLLEVRDEGMGMDAKIAQKVFDPFFTTKATGRGLGLAAVLGITQAHGGAVSIASEPQAGTTFRIYLPASRRPPPRRPEPIQSPGTWRGAGTVLLVDDEERVQRVATKMLEKLGFDVVQACSGDEALERLAQRRQPFECAVVDLTMPGISGIETVRRMREQHPHMPVVLSSGYDETATTAISQDLSAVTFLPKPYTFDQLTEAMRRATESEGSSKK